MWGILLSGRTLLLLPTTKAVQRSAKVGAPGLVNFIARQLLYKGHREKKSLVGPKNKTLVLAPEVAPKCSDVRQVCCRVSVGKYEMSFIHMTLQ